MPKCIHGERTRREGFSTKTNKPWVGYFCPLPKGQPQCPPEFEKGTPAQPAAPSGASRYVFNTTEQAIMNELKEIKVMLADLKNKSEKAKELDEFLS
jgi:hypothetical protein